MVHATTVVSWEHGEEFKPMHLLSYLRNFLCSSRTSANSHSWCLPTPSVFSQLMHSLLPSTIDRSITSEFRYLACAQSTCLPAGAVYNVLEKDQIDLDWTFACRRLRCHGRSQATNSWGRDGDQQGHVVWSRSWYYWQHGCRWDWSPVSVPLHVQLNTTALCMHDFDDDATDKFIGRILRVERPLHINEGGWVPQLQCYWVVILLHVGQ